MEEDSHLGGLFMIMRKWLLGIIIGIALIGALAGLFLYHRQSENNMIEQMPGNSSSLDLGIVYLPVTPSIAKYYGLGVDSGALITQVIKGSPVDQAGIKVGDVIVSFNGSQINEGTPLLGMLRSCPMGHNISLLVWSQENTREVMIVHSK